MKTKEQIQKYNKEYSARKEVIAWAKIRNARPERKLVRKLYKKSEAGKTAEIRYRKKHWDKNAPKREKRRYWRYGLTTDQYESLLKKQDGKCAICLGKDARNIDHCHSTGKVRGLLCGNCNLALGLLKDNRDVLLRAISYLCTD